MAEKRVKEPAATLLARLRRVALFVLFGLVLLIPKLLRLRQRRSIWNALRIVAALAGFAVVVVSWRAALGWPWAALGGLFLVLAASLPPSRQTKTVDQQAGELGALVVLNGGRYRTAGRKPLRANLYVAPDLWYALDLHHRPLLKIPRAGVTSVSAALEADSWTLRIHWDAGQAEFRYDGIFAEHLARVAETALRSQLQKPLPVLRER